MQLHLRPALVTASLLAAAAATPAAAQVLTGPITNPANGHDYFLLEQDTWTNSEAEAVALGGHLVTINDAAENQFVFDTFSTFGGVERNLWIGFNDVAVEGSFEWTSGETPGYTDWDPVEPNNVGVGGVEADYTFIISQGRVDVAGTSLTLVGGWSDDGDFDQSLSIGNFGVVEVVPEPATTGLLATVGLLGLLRRRR
jgi:hypothetical protein